MEQNRTIILVVAAAIAAAIAIGFIVRGTSTPRPPAPTEIAESAALESQAREAPPVSSGPTMVDPSSIRTTASGLQYADLVVGTGAAPQPGAIVSVHYTGWLKDGGTQFDSSRARGKPIKFPLGQGQVIQGWDEGLLTMKVGGKRQLIIPADLAYGQRGKGDIPPGATLVFDVELVDVAAPRVPPAAPQKFKPTEFTTTPSGLKYKDIVVGSGPSPKMGQTVLVEYTGWLENGKMFDSSLKQADPAAFALGQVIAGWNEGLQSMQVGGKRQLVIPPDLAYGADGIPPVIPPNSTLVFEVELLKIGR